MKCVSTYIFLTASLGSTGAPRLVILNPSIDKFPVGGFRLLIGVTSVSIG
jgi:hypothetical protein